MRLVFLGTGWMNLPFIGTAAPPADQWQRIKRGMPAIVLQPNYPEPTTILIDAGQDITTQWYGWADSPARPDAVILTHNHYDHIVGIHDLQACVPPPLPIFGNARSLDCLDRFAQAVSPDAPMFNLTPHVIDERGTIEVCGVPIETFPLHHMVGVRDTALLVRHGGAFLAYLSDTNAHVEDSLRAAIRGCDLLVINTPTLDETKEHIGVPKAITLAREVEAKRLILSHINFDMSPELLDGYVRDEPWITVAHDGLIVDF